MRTGEEISRDLILSNAIWASGVQENFLFDERVSVIGNTTVEKFLINLLLFLKSLTLALIFLEWVTFEFHLPSLFRWLFHHHLSRNQGISPELCKIDSRKCWESSWLFVTARKFLNNIFYIYDGSSWGIDAHSFFLFSWNTFLALWLVHIFCATPIARNRSFMYTNFPVMSWLVTIPTERNTIWLTNTVYSSMNFRNLITRNKCILGFVK